MKPVDGEKETESNVNRAPLLPSCRLTISIMGCLALVTLGLLRTNLTISLVCMIKKGSKASYNRSSFANESELFINTTYVKTNIEGEFLWTRQYQGILLSAYFYGYFAVQLIGGLLAGRFGAKYVLSTAVLIAGAATLLMPVVARFNPYLLILLRAVVGAGTGFIYPSIQSLFGIWAPPLERSILSAITFNGLGVGYMLAFLISSQCCYVEYDNGWPLSFYVTGSAAVLFCVFWNIFVFNSPEVHPRISENELTYIKSMTGSKNSKERKSFPWIKALLSPAVIALLVVQTSHTWFSYAQATSVSLYLKDVLQFDIKQNALFMILPYLLVLLTNPPLGVIADVVRRKKMLSTTAVRKLYQSISSFGSAILIIVIGFLDYDTRYVAVSILMIMNVVNNVGRLGFLINPQDIAPRYSGEVFGIVNTVATLSGILAPIAVGQLTSNGTQHEWRTIFLISAAVFFTGGVVFLIFGQGEPLSWAKNDIPEKPKVNQCSSGNGDGVQSSKDNSKPPLETNL